MNGGRGVREIWKSGTKAMNESTSETQMRFTSMESQLNSVCTETLTTLYETALNDAIRCPVFLPCSNLTPLANCTYLYYVQHK